MARRRPTSHPAALGVVPLGRPPGSLEYAREGPAGHVGPHRGPFPDAFFGRNLMGKTTLDMSPVHPVDSARGTADATPTRSIAPGLQAPRAPPRVRPTRPTQVIISSLYCRGVRGAPRIGNPGCAWDWKRLDGPSPGRYSAPGVERCSAVARIGYYFTLVPTIPIRLQGRSLTAHKAVIAPDFVSRNVLVLERVRSPWGTVCHHVEPGVSRFIPSTPRSSSRTSGS